MPYFLVDGISVYDRLREPKFHLLTFTSGEANHQEETSELAASWTHLLDQHVVPLYPQITEIFGTNKSFNVLLRPDNHVAFISLETSSDRVVTYLNGLGKISI